MWTQLFADISPHIIRRHFLFSQPLQLAAAFRTCFTHFGRLDVVVNNAGISEITTITDEAAMTDDMPTDWNNTSQEYDAKSSFIK